MGQRQREGRQEADRRTEDQAERDGDKEKVTQTRPVGATSVTRTEWGEGGRGAGLFGRVVTAGPSGEAGPVLSWGPRQSCWPLPSSHEDGRGAWRSGIEGELPGISHLPGVDPLDLQQAGRPC